MRHKQEVDCIAGENRGQRVEEIRERVSGCGATHFAESILLTSLEMLEPSTAVQYVKGIGPRLAEVLGPKGIKNGRFPEKFITKIKTAYSGLLKEPDMTKEIEEGIPVKKVVAPPTTGVTRTGCQAPDCCSASSTFGPDGRQSSQEGSQDQQDCHHWR